MSISDVYNASLKYYCGKNKVSNIITWKNKKSNEMKREFINKMIDQAVFELNISRSSQLLAKTNQFKFNSKIFSEKELSKMKNRAIVLTFKDKIQNYGIIGVLILNYKKKNLAIEIENWVMSCRVFSRRLENFILDYLIKEAKKMKFHKINFNLEITKRNKYLQIFLKKSNIKIEEKNKHYSIDISKIKNNDKNYIKLI